MSDRSEDPTDIRVVAALEAARLALAALANGALGACSPWDEYHVTIEKPAMQGMRPEPFTDMHGSVPQRTLIVRAADQMRAALAELEGMAP